MATTQRTTSTIAVNRVGLNEAAQRVYSVLMSWPVALDMSLESEALMESLQELLILLSRIKLQGAPGSATNPTRRRYDAGIVELIRFIKRSFGALTIYWEDIGGVYQLLDQMSEDIQSGRWKPSNALANSERV